MSLGLVLGLFIIAFFVLRKAIMIVPEGTVVKTFLLGKPDKSYSAGLHMGWFDPALYKQIRLKIGAIATATSATSEMSFEDVPRRGKWGSPTAKAFPVALGNAFAKGISNKYIKRGQIDE